MPPKKLAAVPTAMDSHSEPAALPRINRAPKESFHPAEEYRGCSKTPRRIPAHIRNAECGVVKIAAIGACSPLFLYGVRFRTVRSSTKHSERSEQHII